MAEVARNMASQPSLGSKAGVAAPNNTLQHRQREKMFNRAYEDPRLLSRKLKTEQEQMQSTSAFYLEGFVSTVGQHVSLEPALTS